MFNYRLHYSRRFNNVIKPNIPHFSLDGTCCIEIIYSVESLNAKWKDKIFGADSSDH